MIEPAIVLKVIKGFASYMYNTSTVDVVKGVFPDAHESYILEKVNRITERGVWTFLGYLDTQHFEKFCYNVANYANSHHLFD